MSASDRIAIHGDPSIDSCLSAVRSKSIEATPHFTFDENFFLRSKDPFHVPTLPIHHDVRVSEVPSELAEKLETAIARIIERLPGLFTGCRYIFDSARPLQPVFYRIIPGPACSYMYILRISLEFMPSIHRVIEKGSNDLSPAYRTNQLPVDALILPVEHADEEVIQLKRYVTSTWSGETGRGYLTQGIWIDRDFAKFLSGIVVPSGHRLYPWFPVSTRYNSISYTPVDPNPENIDRTIQHVALIESFFAPHMERIESVLHSGDTDKAAELSRDLYSVFPEDARTAYRKISTRPYLNEFEQKEYRVEYETV